MNKTDTPLTDALSAEFTKVDQVFSLCRRLERERAELIEALSTLLDSSNPIGSLERCANARALLSRMESK